MNTQQKKLVTLSFGWSSDCGMLADRPSKRLKELREKVGETPDQTAEIKSLDDVSGCLDRLSSFLLQARRIADVAEKLRRRNLIRAGFPPGATIDSDEDAWQALESMPRIPGSAAALAMRESCTDFESLVFHGSAALDRISKYLIGDGHFRKLKTALDKGKDDPTGKRKELLNAASSLSEVFLVRDDKKIFRDRLTHERSLMEGVNHYFTVHTIEPDKALIFDCEAFGFPVISTAWKLNQDLPYFLLNVLSLEFAELEMIERAGFVPPLEQPRYRLQRVCF